jgi:hypothetical protein
MSFNAYEPAPNRFRIRRDVTVFVNDDMKIFLAEGNEPSRLDVPVP